MIYRLLVPSLTIAHRAKRDVYVEARVPPWFRILTAMFSSLRQSRHWLRVIAVRLKIAPRPIAMLPMAAGRQRDDIRQSRQKPAAAAGAQLSMAK